MTDRQEKVTLTEILTKFLNVLTMIQEEEVKNIRLDLKREKQLIWRTNQRMQEERSLAGKFGKLSIQEWVD